jgi:predicted house-cleaning noncanonical NTP pyrophosphatase (MazG superfamily)
MKIISINYKICEKTMDPILYGVVYHDEDFFNFILKTSATFVHDLQNGSYQNYLVDLEYKLKEEIEKRKERTSDEDLLDIYYLVKTDVKLIDDVSKKIINSWYLTRDRSIKFKTLGL